jgi:hypothetical protein
MILHSTFGFFKKLLDHILGSISNMEDPNEILVCGNNSR